MQEPRAVHEAHRSRRVEGARAHLQVEGHRERRRRAHRSGGALLAEPLDDDVSPQRAAGEEKRSRFRLGARAPDRFSQIAGLARVVGTQELVRLARTGAEIHRHSAPAPDSRLGQQAAYVVRAGAALQAVQHHEQRRRWRPLQPVHVEEVTVGKLPALAAQRQARAGSQQRAEHRLGVAAAQPARRGERLHDEDYTHDFRPQRHLTFLSFSGADVCCPL